jgi:hypothetical protein
VWIEVGERWSGKLFWFLREAGKVVAFQVVDPQDVGVMLVAIQLEFVGVPSELLGDEAFDGHRLLSAFETSA